MKDGLLDWDCAESINISDLEKALSHIRAEGTFPVSINQPGLVHRSSHGVVSASSPSPPSEIQSPSPAASNCLPENSRPSPAQPFVDSKEDKNSVGKCPASEAKIAAVKEKVAAWLRPGQPGHDIFHGAGTSSSLPPPPPPPPLRMCLLDGFLLYSPPKFAAVMSLLDVKFFLQVSRAKATQRREARDGYVTLEGFWKDPPGYVDKIVWPNYVEAHRWMFVDGDVEAGRLDPEKLREGGILARLGEEVDLDFEVTLEWVVEEVMRALEDWYARKR